MGLGGGVLNGGGTNDPTGVRGIGEGIRVGPAATSSHIWGQPRGGGLPTVLPENADVGTHSAGPGPNERGTVGGVAHSGESGG